MATLELTKQASEFYTITVTADIDVMQYVRNRKTLYPEIDEVTLLLVYGDKNGYRWNNDNIYETLRLIAKDGLTYNHRTREFVYHSNEGHNLYYSYDVDNKQSLDIVKQDIERNIRLHHLLKDFDYRFYDYIRIGPEQPNAYTKINFSNERIYGRFELHNDLVQVKIVQYQCWDSSGFSVQLDNTTKIKASTTMDDIYIKIEDARELKADEHFTNNVRTMIENVKNYVVKDYDE